MAKGSNFSVEQIRQLLGLCINRIPVRDAAKIIGCSPATVVSARRKLEVSAVNTMQELSVLSDQQILDLYYGAGRAVSTKGDVAVIRENRRLHDDGRESKIIRPNYEHYLDLHLEKRMTMQLCFSLYVQECREQDARAVCRSSFMRNLGALIRKTVGPKDVYMRQVHPYGVEAGIDYCGDVYGILMPDGKTQDFAICVLTWAASNYTYAEFIPHQSTKDTCNVIAHALQRWQCCCRMLTCDNAKSMVIQHSLGKEPLFNKSFELFAHNLGIAINANKPYGPTGKGYVEKSVGLIQQRCLPLMRLDGMPLELNDANAKLMSLVDSEINAAGFRDNGKGASRKELFEEYERPAALKLTGYIPEYREYIDHLTVGRDYTVTIKQHAYSVPWRYAHEMVHAELSATRVYIMSYTGLIAEHERHDGDGCTMLPEHMPKAHQAMLQKRTEYPDTASVINKAKLFSDTLYNFTKTYFTANTMEHMDCPISIIRRYEKHTDEHRIYDETLRRLMEQELHTWSSYQFIKQLKAVKADIATKGLAHVLPGVTKNKDISGNNYACLRGKIAISRKRASNGNDTQLSTNSTSATSSDTTSSSTNSQGK